ncbi:MAG: sulfotransferase [Bacteroidetes bacterium]|nr:sulfotransferase [Bacteroidota bacterium]
MPNFLIIGAAKSGTSALWRYLGEHPDIFMSKKKEPHFFAYENMEPAASGIGDFTKYAKTDLTSYQALFDEVTTEKIIGEAATTSLYLPQSVERIQHYIPQAKFVAILRQPADRAYSAFMHLVRDHREPVTDFQKALKLEQERIQQNWGFMWHYTNMGFYYEQIKRFYDRFDQSQIRIYLYDELNANPLMVFQDVFRFLEVDDQFVPSMRAQANMSGTQKSQTAQHFITTLFDRPNPIRFFARRILPEHRRWLFTTWIRNKNLQRKQLSLPYRQKLTAEIFQDDILKLQDLIDKDLSHWFK